MVSQLCLTSAREDLGRIYAWLDEAAAKRAIAPRLLARMHVVLEEAVANVALHGFQPGETGRIVVRLSAEPEDLILEIEDTGVAFDPTMVAEQVHAGRLEDVVPGGWGLGLIRKFTRSIAYERRDGMNRLTLRFPADL